MLCEKCHENQVSYIISVSLDSSIKEIRVCEECANHNVQDDMTDTHQETGVEGRECSNCHFRYLQPKLDGLSLLGCPACYTEFREELIPILRRIHGSITHRGRNKVPGGDKRGRSARFSEPRQAERCIATRFTEAGWMQGNGPDCDVVISTRFRLARNLSGYVFCNVAEEAELREILAIVEDTLAKGLLLKNATHIKLDKLDPVDIEFLIERHLISRDLAEKNTTGEVIIGEKEVISIMLNEEDHIRLQVINPGLQLRQSWEMINAIDSEMAQQIDYAYSPELGYLTACPTNVGTGLRISVMLHIPALAATREGNRILSNVSNAGYAVRGIYGEGSQAIGAFYQISNETTLGQSEEEFIDRIRSVTRQLVEREREERELLMERNAMRVEDRIFRAYGTLMNARLISSREALNLLSWISLGVNIGLLPELYNTGRKEAREQGIGSRETLRKKISQLLVLIRPAHLQKYEGRKLGPAVRDVSRAEVIRSLLTDRKQGIVYKRG